MSKTGVMICGHGSRSQAAVDQFSVLAEKLPAYFPDDWLVEYGYLEFANPVIRDGLDKLREAGCDKILAVPGMLFAAMHSKNDIPTVLNTYAAKHGIDISYGRELGVDPKMIAAAGARIQDAVDAANATKHVANEDTCLVVIGRGASDPDANGNVAKIAGLDFVKAGYLNDHEKVLATFAERVTEQMGANPPPNCGICAYREQVLAFDTGEHRHIRSRRNSGIASPPCRRPRRLRPRLKRGRLQPLRHVLHRRLPSRNARPPPSSPPPRSQP